MRGRLRPAQNAYGRLLRLAESGPVVHEQPPLFKQIASKVRGFGLVFERVSLGELNALSWMVRAFAGPVAER